MAGSKYANDTTEIGKANGENAALNLTETIITFFRFAVSEVFGYNDEEAKMMLSASFILFR